MSKWVVFTILILILPFYCQGQVSESDTPAVRTDTSEYVAGDLDFNILIAAHKGYENEVLRLLNKGANINAKSYEGVSPLMYAVSGGHARLVKMLILNGADVNAKPEDGRSALITATQKGQQEIAEELLIAGANVHERDKYGASPLLYASAYNNYSLCDLLLFYGANPNQTDTQQTSPLMAATYAGNIGVAEMLINEGAIVDAEDENGITALMMAVQNGDTAFVNFLIRNGADQSHRSLSRNSAFYSALYNGHTDILDLLWDLNPEKKDSNLIKPDPYAIARLSHSKSASKWLQDHQFRKRFQPILRSLFLGLDVNLNLNDYYLGFRTGVQELYSGFTFELDYRFRPSAKRILIKEDDQTYYQFWEKRHMMAATFGNRFHIFRFNPDLGFGLYLGISGLYSFGPEYRGSNQKARSFFKLNPKAGLYFELSHMYLRLNYEYLNLTLYRISPHWVNFGIYYKINFKRKQFSNKRIAWF